MGYGLSLMGSHSMPMPWVNGQKEYHVIYEKQLVIEQVWSAVEHYNVISIYSAAAVIVQAL